jgi:hypothetical protein
MYIAPELIFGTFLAFCIISFGIAIGIYIFEKTNKDYKANLIFRSPISFVIKNEKENKDKKIEPIVPRIPISQMEKDIKKMEEIFRLQVKD